MTLGAALGATGAAALGVKQVEDLEAAAGIFLVIIGA